MQSLRTSRFMLLAAVLFALVSLICFAYPLYVIYPFRHQGARELHIALFVARIGPWLSIICAAASVALVAFGWRRIRGWVRRSVAVLCVIIAAAGAFFSRVNLYEQMFHPIRRPQFEAASSAKIDAHDMVLAVRVNRASRAYPIRQIAYHHVVNDTVGGVPIAATY